MLLIAGFCQLLGTFVEYALMEIDTINRVEQRQKYAHSTLLGALNIVFICRPQILLPWAIQQLNPLSLREMVDRTINVYHCVTYHKR